MERAAAQRSLDERVAAEVVAIVNNVVVLFCALLNRCGNEHCAMLVFILEPVAEVVATIYSLFAAIIVALETVLDAGTSMVTDVCSLVRLESLG